MGATAPRIPFQSLMTWDWEGSISVLGMSTSLTGESPERRE